jgi:hypothetical protein
LDEVRLFGVGAFWKRKRIAEGKRNAEGKRIVKGELL